MPQSESAAPEQQPSPPDSRDTSDVSILTGTLSRDGTALLLQPDAQSTARRPAAGSEADTDSLVHVAESISDANQNADDDDLENYDDLEVEPDTLIINSRKSMDATYRPGTGTASDTTLTPAQDQDGQRVTFEPAGKSKHKKSSSIQVKLEKTDKRGRYILTADDPEIKEILRKGLKREEEANAIAGGRKQRSRLRDIVFTRQFTTFDRQNPASAESPFFGFFTLFWICMILVFVQVALRNWKDYGSFLGQNQVAKMMFSRDVMVLGLTDGVICAACFLGLPFQILINKGYVSWATTGWIIQNLWQTVYLGAVIRWTYYREWPWTHTIFIALHGLVFLMKQHSYNFYNGYLSSVYKRRVLLERKLKQLEAMEPVHSPPTSPASPQGSAQWDVLSSGTDLHNMERPTASLSKRRLSKGPATSTDLQTEKSDVADVAAAIESGRAIDSDQMTVFSTIIKNEIDDLTQELRGKATSDANAYPNNLSIRNFADYICLPTLVYELEYPRQERTNWWYVAEKTAATFGVLCVMQVISQGYIYPLVAKTLRMKEAGMTLDERWVEFPYIVSELMFPLLIEQLLTWYVIWECILNVLAEVTRFADRGFYGDWWNSVTWDQYARDWNRPVHNFLLRHVYHSSISTFHLSKTGATFVTFLLSALVHEMCMALLFRKFRGYLFWMQLMQMPLVMVSKSRLMRGRVVLGNTIFWIGLFIGPSVLTGLYLIV